MASNWRYEEPTGDERDIMSLLSPSKTVSLPAVDGHRLLYIIQGVHPHGVMT